MGNTELLNFGNYPEIKGHEIADWQFIGRDVHIYLCSWRKIEGVWRRVISGFAELPCDAFPAENLITWRKKFPPADPEYVGLAH